MTVRHLGRIRPGDRDDLVAEGERALRFLEPDATACDVRLVRVG
jgi:hypothetical protein